MEGPRRPVGIWMIVGLAMFNAIIVLGDMVIGTTIADARLRQLLGDGQPVRVLIVCWALLVIAASLLLWRMERRGWALMMVLAGVGLASNLAVWWLMPDRTDWLSMAVSVATAFYLNSSAVRTRFQERHEVSRITLSDRSGG